MPFPESLHPYLNNTDETQTYTVAGSPATIWVTFDSRTAVEDTADKIYIYDKDNVEIGNYTNTYLAGHIIEITGDTVKVRLVSNATVTAWGYRVTAVDTIKPYPLQVDPAESTMLVALMWPSYRGPWLYGSAIYTIVADYNYPYPRRMVVYKSTNYRTWSAVDAANGRVPLDHWKTAAFRSGDKVYLLYPENIATGPLRIGVFNLATEAWESDIAPGGPAATPAGFVPSRQYPTLVRRSDGSFVVAISDRDASWNNNAKYCTWSSGGGWSALSNATSLYPDLNISSVTFLGAGDRVHMACLGWNPTYSTWSKVVLSTLSSGGVLTTVDTGLVVSALWGYPSIGPALTYSISGETWFALPIMEQGTNPVSVIRGVSANTVSEYYKENIGADVSSVSFPPPGLLRDAGGTLYAVWVDKYLRSYWELDLKARRYSGVGNERYANSAGWANESVLYYFGPLNQQLTDIAVGEVSSKLAVLYTWNTYYPWFGLWTKPGPTVGCRYASF